jgi:hypothetical protein
MSLLCAFILVDQVSGTDAAMGTFLPSADVDEQDVFRLRLCANDLFHQLAPNLHRPVCGSGSTVHFDRSSS